MSLLPKPRISRSSYESAASGLLLAAWAALSIAMHVGLLVSLPGTGSGGSPGSRQSPAGTALQAVIVPAVSSTVTDSDWAGPERLSPIAPLKKRVSPTFLPLSNPEWSRASFDEDAYYPANRLTERPMAAEYISVAYPKELLAQGAWRTLLTIYIDEDGTAAYVRVTGTRLPAPFENAAIAAFGRARYQPGKLDGVVVKSRMVVEVEFDNSDADAPGSPLLAVAPNKR